MGTKMLNVVEAAKVGDDLALFQDALRITTERLFNPAAMSKDVPPLVNKVIDLTRLIRDQGGDSSHHLDLFRDALQTVTRRLNNSETNDKDIPPLVNKVADLTKLIKENGGEPEGGTDEPGAQTFDPDRI